jgi:carboxyl-terminal processing protease
MPAINLTCPTTGNSMNNGLGAVLVPSAVNVFFCLATPERTAEARPGDGNARAASEEDILALSRAIHGGGPCSTAMLPDAIGYLGIALFSLDLPARAMDAIARLTAGGARALLLDLRNCPGGDADAALELADDFLPAGAVLAHMVEPDGDELVYRARGGGACDLPVVLLVNGRTASAAELFAGCLAAHRRAVAVGERTYGKGLSQKLVPAKGGRGALYAEAARFLLPDRSAIEGRGIEPDAAIEGASEFARGDAPDGDAIERDAILRRAWEITRACVRT